MNVTIEQKRLSSAEAELQIIVAVDELADSMALRGHLTGPRCPIIETVQIAYPIKMIQLKPDGTLVGRVIIPEPNMWTPETPFIYEGTVELWNGATRIESQAISAKFKTRG